MAFEFPTRGGTLRLLRTGRKWAVEFNGRRRTTLDLGGRRSDGGRSSYDRFGGMGSDAVRGAR